MISMLQSYTLLQQCFYIISLNAYIFCISAAFAVEERPIKFGFKLEKNNVYLHTFKNKNSNRLT